MVTIFNDVAEQVTSIDVDAFTDNAYRNSLLLHIDGALSTLHQNGVGLNVSLINNPNMTWDEFFGDTVVSQSSAKSYVYLMVQLLFDTPQPNIVELLKESAQEYLWRASNEVVKT